MGEEEEPSRRRKSTLESDLRIMNIMMKAQTVQYLSPLRNIGLSSTEDLLDLTKDEFDMICAAVEMKLMDKIRLAHALRDLEGKDDLMDSISVVSGSEPPGITLGEKKNRTVSSTSVSSVISVDSKPPGIINLDEQAIGDAHPVLSEMLDVMSELATQSSERGWFYLDKNGVIQGPYQRHKMRKWFLDGYLKPSLCVRYGKDVAFQPIQDRFQPSKAAFAPLHTLKVLYENLSTLMRRDDSNRRDSEMEGREFLNKWLGV